MRDSWRHFAAEFIGTFALVFIGGAAIMTTQMARMENVLLVVAAAHGLILAVMVTATMRISGHLNPAVTLGFLAARRIERAACEPSGRGAVMWCASFDTPNPTTSA